MVNSYIPECGDVVWISFSPQKGHEQSGQRPAFVLTPKSYNNKTNLALLCPITSKVKGYPFEVLLPLNAKTEGVILADQIKSLDWRERQASFVEHLPPDILIEVQQKIKTLLGFC
jgi:mRNA interferase MazF